MPASTERVLSTGQSVFQSYTFPGQITPYSSLDPEDKKLKLVLVWCQPDDRTTEIFACSKPDDIEYWPEEKIDEYIREQCVPKTHIFSLGDGENAKIAGVTDNFVAMFIMHHSVQVQH